MHKLILTIAAIIATLTAQAQIIEIQSGVTTNVGPEIEREAATEQEIEQEIAAEIAQGIARELEKELDTDRQSAPADPNRMSIRVAGYEVTLNGKKEETDNELDWFRSQYNDGYGGRIGLFEFGYSGFRSFGNSYAAYPDTEHGFMNLDRVGSFHVAINFSTLSTSLLRNRKLGVTMVIGVAYNGYTLDKPVALDKIDGMLRPLEPDDPLKWTKLRSWWGHFPLVLELNPTRDFFVSAGGYADFLLWSDAKWKSPKNKLADPYINPLQLGLTARIGFREWYFFGNYALTEFFQAGKGPRYKPWTFGFGFGF